MRVGIEVGGTFTDLVAVSDEGMRVIKVPSTPQAPEIGAFDALEAAGIALDQVTDLVHGSTVATNAILERRGARVAFVTTAGFRDLLFLQRHDRKSIYDLRYAKPAPPLRRKDCFEVAERIGPDSTILLPLDLDAVRAGLVPALRAGGYEAVAICLLSAYAHPAHERALHDCLAAELPGVTLACSHVVSPEFREFERAATTVLSAYVQPVIDGYIGRFEDRLAAAGFGGRFSIMQSNGGRIPAADMRRNAIAALFSGPAAGVTGAVGLSGKSGRTDIITFDMGGTSTDVATIDAATPDLAAETEIDGLPVRTPILDIATVGAGGGSLVWIDEGGALRVGPRSSGARPGPACYGRGGMLPTITDAHVVRGTIRPAGFLGGTMTLDAAAARTAFEPIAAALGITVEAAADAAIRLAVANVVRAIQLVSTERGRDPRRYALLPFGGAGPLLAAEVADELGSTEVLIPPNPGVMSAFGLLASDFLKVYTTSCHQRVGPETPAALVAAFDTMMAAATADFAALAIPDAPVPQLEAQMRYAGQAFEIAVPIDSAGLTGLTAAGLRAAFDAIHLRVYQHGGNPLTGIELVALRLTVRSPRAKVPEAREAATQSPRGGTSPVTFRGQTYDATLLAPDDLGIAQSGPALIESYSSALWLPPGWTARRDDAGNTILTKEPRA